MSQGEVTNIVREDTTGNILSFLDDTTPVTVNYNSNGDVASVVHGVVGSGTVEVLDYNYDGSSRGSKTAPYALGLTQVGRQVLMGGKPFYGCGINFYDAVDHYNTYNPSLDAYSNYKYHFDLIAAAQIPFVRINIGAFG